jgi:hypothetical protein
VTAVAPGTATNVASLDGKPGTATITVPAPAVSSVTITPGNPVIKDNGAVTLTATCIGPNGAPVSGIPIGWSTTESSIVSLVATGNPSTISVRGKKKGVAQVRASCGAASQVTTVTVVE